ncbi:hypothetical protein G6731_00030 [Polynucleobacter paneuropaeus]|uniref:Uncharacterized protein n=1 Tax=Polynucleobacter paneuropaeus TaxID=2527775 RepID=A0A9Q2WH64_9BURK|nr:hypothetical protein [Polynucleobacter paneuropaeus]
MFKFLFNRARKVEELPAQEVSVSGAVTEAMIWQEEKLLLQEQLIRLQVDLDSALTKLEDSEREKSHLAKIIQIKQLSFDDHATKHRNTVNVIESENIELKKLNQTFIDDLDSKKNHIIELDRELRGVEQQLDQSSKFVLELQSKIDEVHAINHNLLNDLEVSRAEVAQSYKKIEALNLRMDNIQSIGTSDKSENLIDDVIVLSMKNENFLLENLDVKKQYQIIQSYVEKVRRAAPNFTFFESLCLVEVNAVSASPHLIWSLTGYRDSPYTEAKNIEFETHLKDGICGLRMRGVEDCLDILTEIDFSQSGYDRLESLSTGTWKLIRAVLTTIEIQISKSFSDIEGQKFDTAFWAPGLRGLIEKFKNTPPFIRFNNIRIKQELQNQDYEHLWLEISDLSFQDRLLPKFECRVAAANLDADKEKFSRYPKIEFPKIDGKTIPFDSWIPESYDDYGPKLEIRFSLDNKTFDLNVFGKLSPEDRVFMYRFIERLPRMLTYMKNRQYAISRSWENWQLIFIEARDVLINLLATLQNKTANKSSTSAEKLSKLKPTAVEKKKSISVTKTKTKK